MISHTDMPITRHRTPKRYPSIIAFFLFGDFIFHSLNLVVEFFFQSLNLVVEIVFRFFEILYLLVAIHPSCPARIPHHVAEVERQIAADVLGFYAIGEGVVASLADGSRPLDIVSLVRLRWWSKRVEP